MYKRIGTLIMRDMTSALRDNMIIYLIAFPLLLAVCFRMFLPSLQGAKPTFAVDKALGYEFIEQLKNYGNVAVCDGYEELKKRVDRTDDVAGIMKNGNRYVVLAEGNEGGQLEELAGAVVLTITSETPIADFDHASLGRSNSPVKETSASMLILSSIIIAGIMIGLNIVEEKENKTLRGLAVSPVTLFEYIGARAVLALLLAITLSILSSLIIVGFNADYSRIIIGVLLSVAFSVIVGLVMGGLANDQMTAIAIMKVSMLFIICIPIGSLFVPKTYQWLFYVFPNYWVFQIFQNIYTGSSLSLGYYESCIAVVLTSIIFLLILLPVLRKKLKLR